MKDCITCNPTESCAYYLRKEPFSYTHDVKSGVIFEVYDLSAIEQRVLASLSKEEYKRLYECNFYGETNE